MLAPSGRKRTCVIQARAPRPWSGRTRPLRRSSTARNERGTAGFALLRAMAARRPSGESPNGPPTGKRRLMRPFRGSQRMVSPCCAEVTSSPCRVKASWASFCPRRSGYSRSQITRPLRASSRSSRWPSGTGDVGEAVATATAMRRPSGVNARLVKRNGPALAGADGQDPRRRALRDASSIR